MTADDAGPTSTGCFSCVVDDHPRFHLEAIRWYTTLTALAGVAPHELVVHTVGHQSSDALDYLSNQGVIVRSVDSFDPRSPHCNKISGALRMADDPQPGMVILTDTDVVILDDPRAIDLPSDTVASKIVDAPVPPLEVILSIFDAATVAAPPIVTLPWGDNEHTVAGNSNGGLYLIPGPLMPALTQTWSGWARWLLDRIELLQQWSVHVDQVSFALALAASNIATMPLDVRWNTPSHDPTRIPPDAPEPSVIHYHQQVDRNGRLLGTGVPSIDHRISAANHAIDRCWPDGLPDQTYQDWLALRGQEPLGASDVNASTAASLLKRGRRRFASGRRGNK